MQSDYYLVVGIIVGALAVPSLMSAWADRRSPRAGAIMVMIAGGLIALALMNNPGGYRIEDIPDVIVRVIGKLLH